MFRIICDELDNRIIACELYITYMYMGSGAGNQDNDKTNLCDDRE